MRKESRTIIVIPAEGDSAETESWYVNWLKAHLQYIWKQYATRVLIYEHEMDEPLKHYDVMVSTLAQVRKFVNENEFRQAEIHAQGGLGAYVAYEFLQYCPEKIARVFMIGGAPCDAMTGLAKFFHRYFIRAWYHMRGIIPFYADDPNPMKDETIVKIKASSTSVMRKHPEIYREQLQFIGQWRIPRSWKVPDDCLVLFVPNGKTTSWWRKWWDNTYDDQKAKAIWLRHGALITRQPGENFSFYSLMPARALFAVMDEVR